MSDFAAASWSLPILLSSFGLTFVAGICARTTLATLVTNAPQAMVQVVAGAWLAFVVQTALAVGAGSVSQLAPRTAAQLVAGVGFLVFGAVRLTRNEVFTAIQTKDAANEELRQRLPPWLTSFLTVVTGEPLSVALGAIGGLWAMAALVTPTAPWPWRGLTPRVLTVLSVELFALVGILIIVSTLRRLF